MDKTTSAHVPAPGITYASFALAATGAGVGTGLVAINLDWGVWAIFGVMLLAGVPIAALATLGLFGPVTRRHAVQARSIDVEERQEPEEMVQYLERRIISKRDVQKLAELRDKGVISAEEFERIRRRFPERGSN